MQKILLNYRIMLYDDIYDVSLNGNMLLPEHRKEVYIMYDNNFNSKTKEDMLEDRKASYILLRDLAVDFEEQLYSVKMKLKDQLFSLSEKEQELSEIKRTTDHNLNLFSPIHSNIHYESEIPDEIGIIKKKIFELEQNQQVLLCKISGLKTAAKYLDSIDKSVVNIEDENTNRHKLMDKGLGILEAQEFERQRIARDLHDTTVQNLTSLVHKSELCIKLTEIDLIRTKLELNTMSSTLKMIINDMRGIIYNLKPMTLDDLGLTITIQRYANRILNLNNINAKVTSNEEPTEIIPVIKLTIFRIIQEACNNTIKHAKASYIFIDINYQENLINVMVSDNGIGFNIDKLYSSEQVSSFGLSIMKERISLLSGSLDIKSEIGKGTSVYLSVPLAIFEGGNND